jgi:KDO2-lipid IV(A) lauroyltransferase
MIAFLKLLARAPEWFLYGIADFLFFVSYRVIRYRKEVVVDNLSKSFPEKPEEEIKKLTKAFYHNFADLIIENLISIHMTKERILRKVVFDESAEEVNELLKSGKPVTLMASHQANWEWLLLRTSAYFDFPVDVIYQPLDNKKFDKLIFDIRSKFGGYPVAKGNVMRDLVARKDIPRLFVIAGDQTPHISERKHWTTFFWSAHSLVYRCTIHFRNHPVSGLSHYDETDKKKFVSWRFCKGRRTTLQEK